MKKQIPNIITLLNLFSGCIAIVMAFGGNFLSVVIFVTLAAVFDFFDGLAARALGVSSKIGVELDSLADVVSFGVAPGMVVFWLLSDVAPLLPFGSAAAVVPYWAFVIPAFSALRLAKFNIDDRQTTSFIGLPVPAHALFWVGAAYSVLPVLYTNPLLFTVLICVLALVTSLLLVSEIPMFALKITSLKWKGNELRYMLVVCAVVFVAAFGFLGLSGTILLYIVLSIFNKKK